MGKKSGSPQGGTTSAPARSAQEESEPSEIDMRTVDEWCARLFPRDRKGRQHPDLYKHAVAAARHRWAEFEHHTGEPMRCSEADYRKALQLAAYPKQAAESRVLLRTHDALRFQPPTP